jgi:hypothetical protein
LLSSSAADASDDATLWLDQIDLKAMQQRRGVPLANLAVGGGNMIMAGKTYERGIGTRLISGLKAHSRFATCGNDAISAPLMRAMRSKYPVMGQSC